MKLYVVCRKPHNRLRVVSTNVQTRAVFSRLPDALKAAAQANAECAGYGAHVVAFTDTSMRWDP